MMLNAIVLVHRLLMRLYPRQFYALFGEEMSDVFAQTLADSTRRDPLLVGWRCLIELADLSHSLLREHWAAYLKRKQLPLPPVVRARRLTRTAAIAYCLVFAVLLFSQTSSMNSIFEIAIGLASVSMIPGVIIALWRERLGGVALLLTAAINLYLWTLGSGIWEVTSLRILVLLAGVIWVLPFVGFGLMFIRLGMKSAHKPQTVPS